MQVNPFEQLFSTTRLLLLKLLLWLLLALSYHGWCLSFSYSWSMQKSCDYTEISLSLRKLMSSPSCKFEIVRKELENVSSVLLFHRPDTENIIETIFYLTNDIRTNDIRRLYSWFMPFLGLRCVWFVSFTFSSACLESKVGISGIANRLPYSWDLFCQKETPTID